MKLYKVKVADGLVDDQIANIVRELKDEKSYRGRFFPSENSRKLTSVDAMRVEIIGFSSGLYKIWFKDDSNTVYWAKGEFEASNIDELKKEITLFAKEAISKFNKRMKK